ncbi:MAG: hypothetical protein Q9M75_01150 [Ghiorsea sp.]|nr:hypothetical protein [Ghiorsea sp.]
MKLFMLLFFSLFLIIPEHLHAQDNGYKVWKEQSIEEFSTVPIDEEGTMTFAYGQDTLEMRKLASKRRVESETFIASYGNDPVLWWILGELGHIKQLLYHIDLKKMGKLYQLDAPENQALIKKYQSYYRKALELDANPSAPDHLTVDMLANISDDVLADPDIKAKALQKEMELSQSGGYVSENPNYIWETYEVMLENYIQQQDYDSYLKTVNEMIERFPQSSQMDSLLEAKQQALAAIAQRDRDAATQDAYAQADTYVQPKAVAVQKPVKAVEPKKAEAPKVTKEAPVSDNNSMLWWLFGGGVALLGLTGLLRRNNKG